MAALFWWQQALTTAMTPQYAVFVDAQGQMAAALTELVRGIDVAKSFASRESDVGPVAGYRRAAASMTAAVEGATIPGGLQRALVRTLSSSAVLTAGAAGVGALLYWQGLIGPAPLIGFGLLAGSFSQAATPLLTRITTSLRTRGRATTEAQAHALAIDAVLREEELSVVRATESAQPDSPAVVLDRVGFAYDGRDRVLDEFSLTLPTGTVTALVGPSGSGKSTIAELIARFHDPQDGRILLEGDDLRTLSPTDLYRRIAFVFQDIDLLDATVAENIALGRPDASHAEIVDVARRVRIDEVIATLPDGYDTPLTSTSLSTGQRQRLAIARILLTDPRVVVIDEATSAADPESEAAVQQALSELARDRTVLVVAHRLHTVVDADQIVVLDDGVIAEHGTHRDLLDARGAYARLWEAGR
ncbi:ABC transporter ATP-binding protein [Gordonia humi]|uniref:ABC transporter ATP-binding protein n=1 Tax=Gordonia humi TaxID=686429 RepID=UPI003620B6D7